MKKLLTWSTALALTFALWGGQDVQAQDEAAPAAPSFVDENGDGIDDNSRQRHRRGRRGIVGKRGRAGLGSVLSTEQKAEIKALVEGLKASETANADIHAAVEAKLVEWEIERPERPARGDRPERGLNALLDETQEAEIKALVEGLKAGETSGTDIRAAVDAKLAEWEIERPERGLDALLDEDQEVAIKTLVDGLKATETSRADIHAAVNTQLEAWGVERPERSADQMGKRGGKRGGHRGFRGRGPRGTAPDAAPDAPAEGTTDSQ